MAKGPTFRNGNAARHRARMEEKRVAVARYNGTGEPNVVPGYQLAPVLREWTRRWLADRPNGPNGFVGPMQWLAHETGLDLRQVSRITNEEIVVIGEQQAELLLLAIDREYMLYDEIQVVPNPNWSLEKWLAWREERGCC